MGLVMDVGKKIIIQKKGELKPSPKFILP